MKVLDAIANQKDTLIHILHDLHKKFIEEMRLEHVLVEGDAKHMRCYSHSSVSMARTLAGFYRYLETGIYSTTTKLH